MIWPIVWIVVMLGLVGVTVVASMKEKKARAAALKQMTPQPLGDDMQMEDGRPNVRWFWTTGGDAGARRRRFQVRPTIQFHSSTNSDLAYGNLDAADRWQGITGTLLQLHFLYPSATDRLVCHP